MSPKNTAGQLGSEQRVFGFWRLDIHLLLSFSSLNCQHQQACMSAHFGGIFLSIQTTLMSTLDYTCR